MKRGLYLAALALLLCLLSLQACGNKEYDSYIAQNPKASDTDLRLTGQSEENRQVSVTLKNYSQTVINFNFNDFRIWKLTGNGKTYTPAKYQFSFPESFVPIDDLISMQYYTPVEFRFDMLDSKEGDYLISIKTHDHKTYFSEPFHYSK